MCIKGLKCLLMFLFLSVSCCFACCAFDEGGTMGSENIDDFDDDGASTEDRTLAPNEYEGDSNAGAGVIIEEEIPIGGAGDEGDN